MLEGSTTALLVFWLPTANKIKTSDKKPNGLMINLKTWVDVVWKWLPPLFVQKLQANVKTPSVGSGFLPKTVFVKTTNLSCTSCYQKGEHFPNRKKLCCSWECKRSANGSRFFPLLVDQQLQYSFQALRHHNGISVDVCRSRKRVVPPNTERQTIQLSRLIQQERLLQQNPRESKISMFCLHDRILQIWNQTRWLSVSKIKN